MPVISIASDAIVIGEARPTELMPALRTRHVIASVSLLDSTRALRTCLGVLGNPRHARLMLRILRQVIPRDEIR